MRTKKKDFNPENLPVYRYKDYRYEPTWCRNKIYHTVYCNYRYVCDLNYSHKEVIPYWKFKKNIEKLPK